MATEVFQKSSDENQEFAGPSSDSVFPNMSTTDEPDMSAHDLQALIASLLQKDHIRPSPMSEEALEDSIKLAQMKAKKARKQNRLREKNVVNTFKVGTEEDKDKDYDMDAVLKFLGEGPTVPSGPKNKK